LTGGTKTLQGPSALSALMVLSSGRVHIERVQQPATANIMATVDVALNQADEEPPPIVPSMPSPSAGIADADRRRSQAAAAAAVTRPSGTRKSRISWRTTLVLLVIAVAQGLLLAVLMTHALPRIRARKAAALPPPAAVTQTPEK